MSITAALTAFLLILPVELPDKTFVASLMLSTRYRPLPVWAGVSAAFAVQCAVAVAAGGMIALLPQRPVLAVTALLFAVGSVVLLRSSGQEDGDEDAECPASDAAGPLKSALISFGVLFAAEWGDLSQLLTMGLAARFANPLSVFAGSWLALATVSGLAVLLGRVMARRIRLDAVRRTGGVLCALLGVVTGLQALGVPLPL